MFSQNLKNTLRTILAGSFIISAPSVQSQGIPRIIGEIQIGDPPAEGTPGFDVTEAQKKRAAATRSGRVQKLTFQKISQPTAKAPQGRQVLVPQKRPNISAGQTRIQGVERKRPFFTVATTSYEGHGTKLDIWHQGQKHELWSNFSWELMQGFSAFEDDNCHFTFLLFTSKGHTKDLHNSESTIPNLPDLQEEGPRFTASDETPDTILDFVDAAHRLYQNESARLQTAHQKRKANRQKNHFQASRQPLFAPEEIEVTFWRNESKSKKEGASK